MTLSEADVRLLIERLTRIETKVDVYQTTATESERVRQEQNARLSKLEKFMWTAAALGAGGAATGASSLFKLIN